ncbi:hypothetical protein [Thermosphaera aggregans]|jgi:hypothetical protein|uniref:Uncharacterized protein n=1 Tax=Thermosphaera aggregans (strain DSM 11486 / M11TL) TaxID=633148 RepID=D5U0Q5_THEAM|nr:hypothetical protein [Thermosphaera aggregans]ADG90705.1 hypothetical protein Tagg_0430 [Thermosphaera aggregans DSM 11486]
MIGRLSKNKIIIQEAWSQYDIRDILDDVNPILVSKGYSPTYFFEGTPVLGIGGFSVIIKLAKDLTDADYRVIKRILLLRNIKIVEEDKLEA